jgi:hypothetical protein
MILLLLGDVGDDNAFVTNSVRGQSIVRFAAYAVTK